MHLIISGLDFDVWHVQTSIHFYVSNCNNKSHFVFLLSSGAGVGPTIQIGEQTVITVDAKAAGKGKVTCSVCTPEGAELDVDVVENEDGTFDIFYTAPQPGEYVICVRFGGEHIPNSPFQVTVSCLS